MTMKLETTLSSNFFRGNRSFSFFNCLPRLRHISDLLSRCNCLTRRNGIIISPGPSGETFTSDN